MTLAVGTALRNGTYAIDAWVAEDSIGPVYLAMDVSRGQWIQIRVLGTRHPEALPDASERQAFYQYLNRVADLKQAAFPARLGGFEEEGVCYQTLETPPGTSLDRLVTGTTPLSPRATMAIVHQLMDVAETLRPLGWTGLRFTPDQIWYDPESQATAFTGFDLAPATDLAPAGGDRPSSPSEAALVRQLTELLYFLLTGERAEATRAPLAVEVRRRHPALPTTVDTALALGSPDRLSTSPEAPSSLAAWRALLPPAEQLPAEPRPSPSPPPLPPATVVAIPQQRSASPYPLTQIAPPLTHSVSNPRALAQSPGRRPTPALALVMTGLAATASGLGFGLYARLQPASSASQERLNPQQSFPPLPDWNGNDLWQPWNDAPALRDRPDYGNTPPPGSEPLPDFTPDPQEPAAPPPAVPRPEPLPEPVPEPAENWEDPVNAQPQPQPEPAPPLPSEPTPPPAVEPVPPPQPLPAPLPVEPAPTEGAAPPPLTAPVLRPPAPAPSSS
ncbi:hypothetical protein PGN35_004690 [Nodosilinea sp. PGN35]|uniref:hypothetical protein n=1 Tax=Nodosilinea sp. PGN35 TaxID=3020489 RepID=UPI0023B33072|nr:hypothetical protein [Nodosilinea sp. TSF1-S3]MDF0367534.1 hypothetical protein [Nodosilinea sp. TSF1-S3]